MPTTLTISQLTRIIERLEDHRQSSGFPPSQAEIEEYRRAFATMPAPEGDLAAELWDLARRFVARYTW